MATQKMWGGQRPGAGHPTLGTEAEQSVTVTLTPAQITELRRVGGGNASAGVRSLVDAYQHGRAGRLGDGNAYSGTAEVPLSVTLPPAVVVALLDLGGLNVSRGVRRLLQAAGDAPRTTPQPHPQRADRPPANVARLQAAKGGWLGRLVERLKTDAGWYEDDEMEDETDDGVLAAVLSLRGVGGRTVGEMMAQAQAAKRQRQRELRRELDRQMPLYAAMRRVTRR